jgi:hypothetical protein
MLTIMQMRGVQLEFEYYEGSGWSVLIEFNEEEPSGLGFTTFFDAPTADECVEKAYEYFLGVIGG